ncbi:hypothetical protein BJ508DRAFT_417085 [Ascobolus immersus RN42]|uniref:Glutamyl-tRNA amidotransferase complex subunit Gta3 domain-containing protein n=1 Tax=Ascobolus immersus RN42 TaxID=1160509 RepID=A0A3N4HVW6_ASCIM|nr:hypothetical protein BJ508DRAFT_417085 [Ascobolus immersus RN42]
MRTTLHRAIQPTFRRLSSTTPISVPKGPLSQSQIDTLLASPTWSIQSLLPTSTPDASEPSISTKTLHHLLRLSALPLPASKTEEESMLKTLHDQLHFVNSLQTVNTEGVEPVQGLLFGEQEEITWEALQAEISKVEEKKTEMEVRDVEESGKLFGGEGVRKIGRYLVVDDKGDGAAVA